MNEKELGRALLQAHAADFGATPDPRLLTGAILERDRRRVRVLAVAAIVLWLVPAALLTYVLTTFANDFIPKQKQLQRGVAEGKLTGEKRRVVEAFHLDWMALGAKVGAISVAAIALAAIATVMLISASRRATLRQINASLVTISEQLKQLREGRGQEAGRT
jgi:hypothetical protein